MRIKMVVFMILAGLAGGMRAQDLNHLFSAGEAGYACYRIPAIVLTPKGTLLAFAEGRRKGCSDTGSIDLVVKRSADNGKSWSDLSVVWSDAENTCGNPAPVVDHRTGQIHLLSTWNLGTDHESQIINGTSRDTRRIFVMHSDDDGKSWSAPREITSQVKKSNWTWYATGPVNGIQISKGKYRGRLVIPCDHIEAGTQKYYSHTIHSDDGGKTWMLGGTTPTDQVNECTVAELNRGRLLLNMRNYNGVRIRQTAVSSDGGATWSELRGDTALIEPVCQASLITCRYKFRPYLAFSNPASSKERTNLTVRLSFDEGASWKKSFVVYAGPAAYSNLVELRNGNLGCLFEAGAKSPYEGIVFKELSFSDFK